MSDTDSLKTNKKKSYHIKQVFLFILVCHLPSILSRCLFSILYVQQQLNKAFCHFIVKQYNYIS